MHMTKLNICLSLAEADGTLTTKLTHVEDLWIRKRVENRTPFRIKRQHIISPHHPIASSIDGFLCWDSDKCGTASSRIDIFRAAVASERHITVQIVHPRAGSSLWRVGMADSCEDARND
jgi:hypothetical protein